MQIIRFGVPLLERSRWGWLFMDEQGAVCGTAHRSTVASRTAPLTRNEIRRLFTGLHQQQSARSCGSTGPDGDANLTSPCKPANTAEEESLPQEDYELSLKD